MKKRPHKHLHRRPAGPGGWYYYRRVINGEPVDVALEVQDDAQARALRDYYDALVDAEETDRRLGRPPPAAGDSVRAKLGLNRRAAHYSSPDSLRLAWFDYCHARKAAPRTAPNAWSSLLLVLRTAGVDVSKPWRLEQLDGAAVARYEAAALARRRTPLEVDRGRSTAFSTLNQARMVVSHRAQRSAQYAGLRLPASVEEFLTRTVERGRPAEKPAIGVETMRRFERGRALMRRFAPRHWLALLLARELGLRAGEVVHARWDWVREVASQVNAARRWWQCAIVITDAFGPKGRPRRFDLDAGQVAAWQEALTLRGTLSPAAEVLPGTLADRERVLDELREWLRAIGIARDPKVKPLHLLRALRATELAETRGIDAAQAHLGHESARTTRAHYLLPAQP